VAWLNSEGFLLEVKSVVKHFADNTVLQAIHSKHYMYRKLYIT